MTRERALCGFSKHLDIRLLERESRRLLFIGFLLGILFHAGLAVFVRFGKPVERVSVPTVPSRPMKTDLIALPPRHLGFVGVHPHPFRKKTYIKPGFQREPGYVPVPPESLSAPAIENWTYSFQEESVKMPDIKTDIDAGIAFLEPPAFSDSVRRIDPREFSFREELLTVEDFLPLAEQQKKGFVFCNPNDRFAITGVVPLPILYSSSVPPTELSPSLRFLAEGLKKFTGIIPVMTRGINLYQNPALRYPFLYIACSEEWNYYPFECEQMREYLIGGGFAVFENLEPWEEGSPAELSLKQFIRDALGSLARFVPISDDHPLYHCFFEFPEGPPIGSEYQNMNGKVIFRSIPFLEGVWIRGRLAAIFSNKGYGLNWRNPQGGEPQLKMGVNMVVFALLQEGGKAEKRFDPSLEPGIAVKRWMSVEKPFVLGAKDNLNGPGVHIRAGYSSETYSEGAPYKR